MKSILALLTVAVTLVLACTGHFATAAVAILFAGTFYASGSARLCTTLTSTEILREVIASFKKNFPALNKMGYEFRPTSLKLDNQYIAHIPTLPTVEDVTTTYATTGQTAKSLLVDVPVTVSRRRGVRLKWEHVAGLQDSKQEWDECINNAGFALAKNFIDDLLAEAKSVNFSQSSTYAEADCDLDMLINVRADMNGVGASPMGRAMIVNSNVASTLEADSRISSRDFHGQAQGGVNALRRWNGVGGFSEIIEYADMPLNNASAITGGAIEADDDIYTKTTHGLVTGQRVQLTSFSGGTGLTSGTYWYFSKIDANTGYLCTTPALAQAGTLGTACTVDATSVVLTPTENVVAFGFERSAIAFLAGIPDNFDHQALKSQLGIPDNMNFEAVTFEGITMGAVSWQDVGTGDLTWMPVLVWGKALGRQAGTNAVGSKCDYGGHLVIKA